MMTGELKSQVKRENPQRGGGGQRGKGTSKILSLEGEKGGKGKGVYLVGVNYTALIEFHKDWTEEKRGGRGATPINRTLEKREGNRSFVAVPFSHPFVRG